MRKYRVLSALMSICLILTSLFATELTAFAADNEIVYVKQDARGYCTLASTVMMMRQKALNEGNRTWNNITQQSLIGKGWITGQGLKASFKYCGIGVGRNIFDVEDIKSQLISLLDKYPEGIVIYDKAVPHAVLLISYDENIDTFYCADPGLSTKVMKLQDSWMKSIYNTAAMSDDEIQDALINALDAYWYITSYSEEIIPVYVKPTPPITGETVITPIDTDVQAVISDSNVTSGNKSSNNNAISSNNKNNSKPATSSNNKNKTANSSTNDFAKKNFKDLSSSEWHYDYIAKAYNSGLMNGVDDVYFKPDNDITIAQSVTLAARIYSIHNKDGENFKEVKGKPWYTTYVDYARKKKIISSRYADSSVMNYSATRAEFAEIINGALPDKELSQINNVKNGDIKDVSSSDSTGKAVYRLYRAGIITGSNGNFSPSTPISRAQVAAIVARMSDAKLRVKV